MGTTDEEHGGEDAGKMVDELIPPPWSRRRRGVVGLAAGMLVAILGLLWWAGVLTPNLAAELLGGEAEVGTWADDTIIDTSLTIRIPIENRGRVTATIHDWRPPATDGITWADAADPLPITLAPGASVELRIHAEVASCREVNARGTDRLDLVTQGPLGPRTTSSVDPRALATVPSWPTGHDANHLVDPDRHEPSWLYHPLAWACDPSAIDLEDRE